MLTHGLKPEGLQREVESPLLGITDHAPAPHMALDLPLALPLVLTRRHYPRPELTVLHGLAVAVVGGILFMPDGWALLREPIVLALLGGFALLITAQFLQWRARTRVVIDEEQVTVDTREGWRRSIEARPRREFPCLQAFTRPVMSERGTELWDVVLLLHEKDPGLDLTLHASPAPGFESERLEAVTQGLERLLGISALRALDVQGPESVDPGR